MADLIFASQVLQTIFDSSVGRSTVNHPRWSLLLQQASVQKLPVQHGVTTASVMAGSTLMYENDLLIMVATYAVIEATARLVAAGAKRSKARSLIRNTSSVWINNRHFGQPISALLGSNRAQIQPSFMSIGGKDSMSGTFEELTVPPTLVAFGHSCR